MGNHRSDHRATNRSARRRTSEVATPNDSPTSTRRPSATGTRRAATPGRRRSATSPKSSMLSRLPAIPTLVGIVALAVAGAGAVKFDQGDYSDSSIQLSSQGRPLLSGTDAIGFAGSPRAMAISRDSERMALQDAAQAELLVAANEQAAQRNAELKSLGRAAEARASEIAKNLWRLPTVGYHLTARFGMSGGLWSSNHTGLDFAAPSGTPIFAVANGVITEAGYDGSYGNKTVERLEDGTEIWYCHQTSISVNVGDTVTGGQGIGSVGSTGNVTGPHLHLEVRPGGGDPVDPFQAFVYHGVNP